MRIEIRSGWDGQAYHIDSLNPELLARWLLETVGRIRPTAAAPAAIQAWPSFDPVDGRADWITDSRVLGRLHHGATARELLDALAADLAAAERLREP